MVAGDWLSDPAAVSRVVKGAPDQIKELIAWGVNFDKTADGSFDLHRARNVSTLPLSRSST